MIPDGIRIDQELLDGKPYDIVYFAKFKKMIEKQHRNLAIVAHDAGAAAHIFLVAR